MLLNILIPSTSDRNVLLSALLKDLSNQIVKCNALKKVEVLVELDEYQFSTGVKRNMLNQKVNADYCCSVDDDDRVPPYYIEELLRGIKTKPDCVSLIGEYRVDGGSPIIFKHSIDYNGWYEKEGILYS